MDPQWTEAGFCLALERFGYDVTDKMAATMAFQRRFRPELVD
ncbi:MAG: N-acetylmuramoyl-L-alanine amidase, partial [Sphingomonas sp.]